MKFIIDGVEHEASGLERVTGAMALDLPRQAGIGLQQLATRLGEAARLAYDEHGAVVVLSEQEAATPEGAARVDQNAVVDSEPHLRAFLAFLWLTRRLDGERSLTFDEACQFRFSALQIVDDSEPEAVEPENPTQPGSDPVAEVAASA